MALLWSGCAVGLTRHAEQITGTTALITGQVISDVGGPIQYWVQYGTTTSYSSESQHASLSAPAMETVPIEVPLTGLTRGTTYHYRVCATDSQQKGGPGCGPDRTLVTPNLECGDVVTHDFRLSRSLTCSDPSFQINGIVVGAAGIDIDLAGHTLTGPNSTTVDATTPAAVDNTGGFDDVTIHDGHLRAWGRAILLDGASRNRIRGIDSSGNSLGVDISGGAGNVVRYSKLDRGSVGLGLDASHSSGLLIADSTGSAWSIVGDDARVLRNQVQTGQLGLASNPSVPCLTVYGNRNRLELNRLLQCLAGGIVVRAGTDNVLVENEILGPPGSTLPADGIRVESFTAGTLLSQNYSHDNPDDGIDVRASAAQLADNRADNNDDLGIDAVAGVTDLGGNSATGNGNPLQCRNVFCE